MYPTRIAAINVAGAGMQIHAAIPEEVNCVEFTMKAMPQPVVETRHIPNTDDPMIGYEPWTQFAPEKWREMINKLLPQMAEAWNEKYADGKKVVEKPAIQYDSVAELLASTLGEPALRGWIQELWEDRHKVVQDNLELNREIARLRSEERKQIGADIQALCHEFHTKLQGVAEAALDLAKAESDKDDD